MLYSKNNIIKDSNLITIETEDSIIYNPDHETLLSDGWGVYKEEPNTKIIENKGFVQTTSEEFALLDKSVYKDTIVFIEDVKQIWRNGIYYNVSDGFIEDLQSQIDELYLYIDEIKTGGPNMLGRVSFENSTINGSTTDEKLFGENVYLIEQEAYTCSSPVSYAFNEQLKGGLPYVLSFYSKAEEIGGFIMAQITSLDGAPLYNGNIPFCVDEWGQTCAQIWIDEDLDGFILKLQFAEASNIYISCLKLQAGNTPTAGFETPATTESNESITMITWTDLYILRSQGKLIPGHQYRIMDYVTTTDQEDNIRSAGNPFDIIVTADSTNVLNETARAVRNPNDDGYFDHARLEAWEIKYCFDNDYTRFAWADMSDGKGVIYWMKDEYGNECPYDFKNIQFNLYSFTDGSGFDGTLQYMKWLEKLNSTDTVDENTWVYTFSTLDGTDITTAVYNAFNLPYAYCHNNIIKASSEFNYWDDEWYSKLKIMRNAFILTSLTGDFEDPATFVSATIGCNFIDEHSYNNLFSHGCFGNKIGKYINNVWMVPGCKHNTVCDGDYEDYKGTIFLLQHNSNHNTFSHTWNVLAQSKITNFNVINCNTLKTNSTSGDTHYDNFNIKDSYSVVLTGSIVDGIYQNYNIVGYEPMTKLALDDTDLVTNSLFTTNIVRKSNGKIVIYNEADLIADQY